MHKERGNSLGDHQNDFRMFRPGLPETSPVAAMDPVCGRLGKVPWGVSDFQALVV